MKASALVMVYGQKGSGKTTLLRRLIARTRRLLIADVTGDYDTVPNVATVTDATAAAALFARAGARPCRVRLTASMHHVGLAAYRGTGHDARTLGLRAAAIAWAAGDCLLVLDELALYTTASTTPPILQVIGSYGRHRRVSIAATTRRPAEVSLLLRGLADFSAFFRLTAPPDLAYAVGMLGPAGKRLPALPIGRALAVGNPAALRLLQAPDVAKLGVETLDVRV